MQLQKDQMGRLVEIPKKINRIVSLVPSQTELLFDLGLDVEVVGVTRFCVHPNNWRFEKKSVGGTKTLKIQTIRDLKPDLIIGNKEENSRQDIEQLWGDIPVWMSDIFNVNDCCDMIKSIGSIVSREERALQIVNEIEQAFAELENVVKANTLKVAYLIWKKPYMVAGKNTFINHLLEKCGFTNCFTSLEGRYPIVNDNDLKAFSPDIVLYSSEPYPFREIDSVEVSSLLPSIKHQLVDGEMFSWYGSRLKYSPKYFVELIKALQ
jgi:ABC-type Fe3+-hydroxamate transport system substrate-binding protein